MGTSALVAMERPDGLYNLTYISYDGYLAGVGLTLFEFWNDPAKITELTNAHWIGSLEARYRIIQLQFLSASLQNYRII